MVDYCDVWDKLYITIIPSTAIALSLTFTKNSLIFYVQDIISNVQKVLKNLLQSIQ